MVKLANAKIFDKAMSTSDFELIALAMQVESKMGGNSDSS